MPPSILQIYASIECPYAYLATYRLRQVYPLFEDRLRLLWRALPLEYINHASYPKPAFEAERSLFAQIEPNLPFSSWSQPDWEWPTTFWPAFEALACVQAQGDQAALEFSWELRVAFFAQSQNISMRHILLMLAENIAERGLLYFPRFESDFNSGQYKRAVLGDAWRGWHDLKLAGSATFVLPDRRKITNPAIGKVDFDDNTLTLNSYTPYPGDPLKIYRALLADCLGC